jgi:hypothetical protein
VLSFLGGPSPSGAAAVSRVVGGGLLALALAAAAGLLLTGSGLWTPAASTFSLWYVMVLGLAFGTPAFLPPDWASPGPVS